MIIKESSDATMVKRGGIAPHPPTPLPSGKGGNVAKLGMCERFALAHPQFRPLLPAPCAALPKRSEGVGASTGCSATLREGRGEGEQPCLNAVLPKQLCRSQNLLFLDFCPPFVLD